MFQDVPGPPQDGTETAPGRPITFQDAPKTAPDAFTTGQDRSRMAHMLPNDDPSHAMIVCSVLYIRHFTLSLKFVSNLNTKAFRIRLYAKS